MQHPATWPQRLSPLLVAVGEEFSEGSPPVADAAGRVVGLYVALLPSHEMCLDVLDRSGIASLVASESLSISHRSQ